MRTVLVRILAAAVVMPARVIIVMVVMAFVFRIPAAAGMMRMLRMAVGGGVLMVAMLVQRMREVRSGELDDLDQY